ncbi:MAG: hypothetical protein Q8R35_03015 [bacterium]|nr:hypothetical protein [bacterium]
MRYRLVYTADFEKAVLQHGLAVRWRLEKALTLLVENPFHPQLHTKALAGQLEGSYSFRLGRDVRVIFVFREGSVIHLLKISKRGDIYR